MNTAVIVPWRPGCPHRERALNWTLARYSDTLPDVPVVLGGCDPQVPFNRSAAILDGVGQTDADVLIVTDGDCWSSGLFEALGVVVAGAGWAVPHRMLCRLTADATERVLAGEAPEDQDDFAERPYRGHEAGTLLVIRRDVLLDVPPDVRFRAWGQEDDAWALALRALVGKPWRGDRPIFHLWHPPQPRKNRAVGSDDNLRLYRRYRQARHPDRMRALVEEAKHAAHAS